MPKQIAYSSKKSEVLLLYACITKINNIFLPLILLDISYNNQVDGLEIGNDNISSFAKFLICTNNKGV